MFRNARCDENTSQPSVQVGVQRRSCLILLFLPDRRGVGVAQACGGPLQEGGDGGSLRLALRFKRGDQTARVEVDGGDFHCGSPKFRRADCRVLAERAGRMNEKRKRKFRGRKNGEISGQPTAALVGGPVTVPNRGGGGSPSPSPLPPPAERTGETQGKGRDGGCVLTEGTQPVEVAPMGEGGRTHRSAPHL